MVKTFAIKFNDQPNVIHLARWEERGASVVELKLMVEHPRLKTPTIVYYRKTSVRGQNVYFYSKGSKAGEALGG